MEFATALIAVIEGIPLLVKVGCVEHRPPHRGGRTEGRCRDWGLGLARGPKALLPHRWHTPSGLLALRHPGVGCTIRNDLCGRGNPELGRRAAVQHMRVDHVRSASCYECAKVRQHEWVCA